MGFKSNRRLVQAYRRGQDLVGETPNPWWNPLGDITCIWAAYQSVGAASFAASLLDLSGNGNHAVDPGGAATPTWDAVNGWTMDGAATYLATTFVPQNDQSQSILVQFTNCGPTSTFIVGSRSGADREFGMQPNIAGALIGYYNGRNASELPSLASGNCGVAGAQGYRDGVADGGAIGSWLGSSDFPCLIGCTNDSGTPASFCPVEIQATVIYDCAVPVSAMLAVATAMAAF